MALLGTPLQTWSQTPPVTRSLVLTLIALSSAYQYIRYFYLPDTPQDPATSFPYVVLVPGVSYWYPWTLLTASLIETNVMELIVSLLSVPLSLRYLERLWGSKETLKFVGITCGVSNLIALGVNWLEYTVLGEAEMFLFNPHYRGLMALQIGCLVAFTQVIPEHQIQLFGAFKMRVKQVPMIYVTLSTVMCLIGYQTPIILVQFGWLVSWIYLRFYKKTAMEGATLSGGAETRGDRSETFAFIYWFPPFLHVPVGLLSDIVYKLAVKLKLVQPSQTGDIETGGYAPVSSGSARAEAERRRAMALKALDQRMANSTNKASRMPTSSSAGPSQSEPAASSSSGPSDSGNGNETSGSK